MQIYYWNAVVSSILKDTMKRPKTSKIVVYTIVEDTIYGLQWVHNRFLCAPSCPIAYTLSFQSSLVDPFSSYSFITLCCHRNFYVKNKSRCTMTTKEVDVHMKSSVEIIIIDPTMI